MRNLLIVFLALFYCSPAVAACTDGIDCYCDLTAPGSGDALADASRLHCRDFDAPGLYLNPGSNNWASGNGLANDVVFDRGLESTWFEEYGAVVQLTWPDNEPANPYTGGVCDVEGSFTACNGPIEYCSAAQGTDAGITTTGGGDDGINCWGSATYDANINARIDIQKLSNLDYKSEVTSLEGPTYEAAHSNYHLAIRVPAGQPNTNGVLDDGSWTGVTELGITMLVAYASNIEESGILNRPWKSGQFDTSPSTFSTNQFPLSQVNGACIDESDGPTLGDRNPGFPFCPMWAGRGNTCSGVSYNSGSSIGSVYCEGGQNLRMVVSGWDGSAAGGDMPLDEWVCVRGWVERYHSTTSRFRIWVTTASVTDKLILDIFDLDTSTGAAAETPDTINKFHLDGYANANAFPETPPQYETTEVTYRHEDNIHIRSGSPVSCAQVGFVAGAAATASISGRGLSGRSRGQQ